MQSIASDADIGAFDLVARNADNEFISLTRLNCDEESEMLGLWMSSAGKNTKMISSLRLAAGSSQLGREIATGQIIAG